MKEQDFLSIIQAQTKSSFLGDDCAHLKDLGIVVSQDNFIEDIHFKTSWATPYQIGYKAVAVNISDILASGGKPKYLSVGLSLPNVTNDFVSELYRGFVAGAYGAEIIGGDITGGDKICISITAIGTTKGRKISSRKNAKVGHVVIASGEFGLSSKGLKLLQENIKVNDEYKDFINAHLEPVLNSEFSESISTQIDSDYAMMDTSDGLADALFQIAKASGVKIITPFIDGIFGAEDYNLVATLPREFLSKMKFYKIIGEVVDFDGTYLQIADKKYVNYDDLNLFDHFSI